MGKKGSRRSKVIVALSGGPDSVFLLHRALEEHDDIVVAHVNHGARGAGSDADERFVRQMAGELGLPARVHRARKSAPDRPGFEERARRTRYAFLKRLKEREGAGAILVGHTADDQVETVLMRVFRGAGISGLKGIPCRSDDGVVRPLLQTWREEILASLRRRGIPHRRDESNAETRFERNWIRHVLLPLLELRYGGSVKKRIQVLGERFREIDEFVSRTAESWIARHLAKADDGESFRFERRHYADLPPFLRKMVLSRIGLDRVGVALSERRLEGMDRLILSGGPSATLSLGGGVTLERRYEEAVFRKSGWGRTSRGARVSSATPCATSPLRETAVIRSPGVHPLRDGRAIVIRECACPPGAGIRSRTKGEATAYFDPDGLAWPVRVRPLRAGDRVRPFGMESEKKVKEILIDRKVPRSERWGRPVVCDRRGRILWVPGVVRSAWFPVRRAGGRALLLEIRAKNPQLP